jgi:hypothetical protein
MWIEYESHLRRSTKEDVVIGNFNPTVNVSLVTAA